MGTRSLTHVIDENDVLVTIYRQYDGYPGGMGLDIYNSLGHKEIVNGIPLGREHEVINGIQEVPVLLLYDLKKNEIGRPGSLYIFPPNSFDYWEEFVYRLWLDGEKPNEMFYVETRTLYMSVHDLYKNNTEIYNGPLKEYKTWLETIYNKDDE